MTLGERIQALRKENGFTQSVLAEKIQISLPQIVRYETKNVQPPADALKRIANVFGTSIDYLVNGDLNEKAQNSINDSKLLQHFKAIEGMNDEDKSAIVKVIENYLLATRTRKAYTS